MNSFLTILEKKKKLIENENGKKLAYTNAAYYWTAYL